MVADAGGYRWSSFASYGRGQDDCLLDPIPAYDALAATPAGRRRRWTAFVRETPGADELAALRWSVQTGLPFGDPSWVEGLESRLGLDLEIRPRGRPRKPSRSAHKSYPVSNPRQ
jgi:putative transposase